MASAILSTSYHGATAVGRVVTELWRYRALLWALVCRHVNARYRGSMLGFVWSFLNPLCLIAVYSLVFQYYIRFDGTPHYTLFLFAGLLPWIWFSSGLIEATGAISGGGSLVTKAMFPPHILPIVSILTNLANFLFAIPLLIGVMLYSGIIPGAEILLLPVVILVELIFMAGLALGLSAINVHYRDVQHILGNVMSLWFFLCPIIYPVSNVPERFKATLLLNPVALFTEMYHAILLEGAMPQLDKLLFTAVIALTAFVIGAKVHYHYREGFAELV